MRRRGVYFTAEEIEGLTADLQTAHDEIGGEILGGHYDAAEMLKAVRLRDKLAAILDGSYWNG